MTDLGTPALTLGQALGVLYAEGTPPPCHGSGLWTSDDPEHRRIAAEHCPACPITTECLAAAVEGRVTFGVWAGHDLAVAAGRRAARAAHEATR